MLRALKYFLPCILMYSMQIQASASSFPNAPASQVNPEDANHRVIKKPLLIKAKDLKKLLGRKLSLKEKIAFFLFKRKVQFPLRANDKVDNGMAIASLVIGLLALAFLIIGLFPFSKLIFLTIGFGILAIIFGTTAHKKDRRNKMAKAGKLLGWLSLGLLVLLIVAIILFWVSSGAAFVFC